VRAFNKNLSPTSITAPSFFTKTQNKDPLTMIFM